MSWISRWGSEELPAERNPFLSYGIFRVLLLMQENRTEELIERAEQRKLFLDNGEMRFSQLPCVKSILTGLCRPDTSSNSRTSRGAHFWKKTKKKSRVLCLWPNFTITRVAPTFKLMKPKTHAFFMIK